MSDDFLLTDDLARTLYFEYAAPQPIIDYHNHLSVEELADDRQFADLAGLWLDVDPYKHRAMRILGIPEAAITGRELEPEARFRQWAAAVPQLTGSPLAAWTRLELSRLFDFNAPLQAGNAAALWRLAAEKLKQPEFSPRRLLRRFRVERACPCRGLADELAPFERLNREAPELGISPSLRGDELLAVDDPAAFAAFAARLGDRIKTPDDLFAAVEARLDELHAAGCRVADFSLDADFLYLRDDGRNSSRLAALLAGESLPPPDRTALRSALLRRFGEVCAARRWLWQLHLGALRQTSTRLRRLAGPAGGYAAIGGAAHLPSIAALLDDLEQSGAGIPRTVLFSLNPADLPLLATLTGSFAADGVRGLVQAGPAWWYNDHRRGIAEHLDILASYGVLSSFIGMTTDSRALPSMVRHEYFRRVLSSYLASRAAAGEIPADPAALGPLVRQLAYENAAQYLREAK